MEIKIAIVGDPLGNANIVAHLEGTAATGPDAMLIGGPYADAAEALQALVTALCYGPPDPPDLAPYEEGLTKLGELATQQEDVVSALGELGTRLNQVEDRLDGLAAQPAAAPVKQSLLPGREVGLNRPQPAKAQLRPQPAPIRRQPPMTKDLPEQQRALPSRVHGQLFGGVSRRGMGPIEEPAVDFGEFDPNAEG